MRILSSHPDWYTPFLTSDLPSNTWWAICGEGKSSWNRIVRSQNNNICWYWGNYSTSSFHLARDRAVEEENRWANALVLSLLETNKAWFLWVSRLHQKSSGNGYLYQAKEHWSGIRTTSLSFLWHLCGSTSKSKFDWALEEALTLVLEARCRHTMNARVDEILDNEVANGKMLILPPII